MIFVSKEPIMLGYHKSNFFCVLILVVFEFSLKIDQFSFNFIVESKCFGLFSFGGF